MKRLLLSAVFTAAIFSAPAAYAACNVTPNTSFPALLTNPLIETDCASAAVVTSQGGDISTLQGTATTHEGWLTTLQTDKADKSYVDNENAAQDSANTTKNDEQDAAIATEKGRNDTQDTTLADHETRITANKARLDTFTPDSGGADGSIEKWAGGVNKSISDIENVNTEQWKAIHDNSSLLKEHSATLSQHTQKLEEHEKGLAIAMAMPDVWLSDSKSFGVFGSVGGFGDETALGFAAIGRVDKTWSLNAKFGGDTEFKQFGWSAGAGAQW